MSGWMKTHYECVTCWRIQQDERSFESAHVIIGLSFGGNETTPGLSNYGISLEVKLLHDELSIPLILQWGIAKCLPRLPVFHVICKHRRGSHVYLDTYEVLMQAKEMCNSRKWTYAIIVCHPDHAWRVKKTAEKLGFDVTVADTTSVPYDSKSAQP